MKLASEILILALMIVSNGRVFITKKSGFDTLVVLSPIAFLLAILHLFAFGIDLFSVIIILISFLAAVSNLQSLLQFSSHLIIDRYSPLMITWAVINIVLSAITLSGVVYFSPIELRNERLGISETQTQLSGNFLGGFREAETFAIADAHLFEFSSIEESTEEPPIVIFMPDKRGDTQNYKPYLQLLAQSGFTCYSADFFARDGKWLHAFGDKKIMRRIALVIQSLTDNPKFMRQREFYTYNFSLEYSAMINLLDNKNSSQKKYFLVTDNLGFDAAKDISKKYPEKIAGIFDISTVASYKTSGYGFVEQTDPLLAQILGAKRDATFKNTKEVVLQTKNAITGEKYDVE